MKSRALIPGVNEPMSSVHLPILCCASEECSRFSFINLDFCGSAALRFPVLPHLPGSLPFPISK